jgi:hypothetical protein
MVLFKTRCFSHQGRQVTMEYKEGFAPKANQMLKVYIHLICCRLSVVR